MNQNWLIWAAWLGLAVGAKGSAAATPAPVAAATLGPAPTARGVSAATVRSLPPPRLPAAVGAVPMVRQARPYSCGPAVLTAVLRSLSAWAGVETDLYRPLGTTPEDGTLPEKLAEVARDFGLDATIKQHMTVQQLRAALGGGKLVILELQAWPSPGSPNVPWSSRWDDGHYVVLIAMDAHYAYFMDPSVDDAYAYLELGELLPRWHDINEVRKDPKLQRDYQLGVVIGRAAKAPALKAPAGGPLRPPARLLKLE